MRKTKRIEKRARRLMGYGKCFVEKYQKCLNLIPF